MASRKEPVVADPISTTDRKSYFEHIKKINDVYYDQVGLADQKAAYIFTFMIAFLISSAEGRQVFDLQRYQSGEPVAILLSACVGLALTVSLVSAILVVLPRHGAKATSLYWGGWASNRPKLIEAMDRQDPDYLADEYLANIDALAAISRSKFAFLRTAFRGLVVVVVGYVLLLVWQMGTA